MPQETKKKVQKSENHRPCVLIACEVRLYREGLAHSLARDNRLSVSYQCQSTDEVLAVVTRQSIGAALVDTGMSGALGLVEHIVASTPQTKVIALGLNEVVDEVMPFVEAGAAGYVCRNATVDDVVQTVLCALNEELICSRRIAAALQQRVRGLASSFPETQAATVLTRREVQIAQLLDAGLSNKDIAKRSNISISTVKNHVHNIFEKLHARSRAEAAAKFRALRTSQGRGRKDLPSGSAGFILL